MKKIKSLAQKLQSQTSIGWSIPDGAEWDSTI